MPTKENKPANAPARRRHASAKPGARPKAPDRKKRPAAKDATQVPKRRPVRSAPEAQPSRSPAAAGGSRTHAPRTKTPHIQRPRTQTPRPQRPRRRSSVSRMETEVVYTAPKPFRKLKLLLGLAIAAAVVLAMTLGMSIFFKVAQINVSGMDKYSAWDVREASGLQEGDNLLTLSKARISGKIIARLPYVDQVRIGIKLPDTVNIEITELEVIYSIQGADNSWWLINGQGRVLEKTTGVIAGNYTQILGVRISEPVIGQQAVAVSEQALQSTEPPTEATAETEPGAEATQPPTAPVPVETADASQQLLTALTIIQHLEHSGVVGEVTNVNVADLFDLQLLYDDRYQVLLGDSGRLDYKVRAMKEAAMQMTDYQQGILDVSFTTWPTEVGYTPFED